MVARLVVEEGDLKGLTLPLEEGDTWIIGRDPDTCQLVLSDPLVSRQHLRLHRSAEGIEIANISQTNRVEVNGEEIVDEPRLLHDEDTIKLGNQFLRYFDDLHRRLGEEAIAAVKLDDMGEIEPTPSEERRDRREEEPPPPPSEPSPNTLFGEENPELAPLAEIDFGVVETGRWLLKVISGPNNGAEFYMQTGRTYVLGTDPSACDIVFHDTSVSRQHAKITISPEDVLYIEDLKSRNGVIISGNPIEGRQTLTPNTIVTLGTTSLVVYDREGEMQTIISPLLPSIVKVLQQEPPKEEAPPVTRPEEAVSAQVPPPVEAQPPIARPSRRFGPYVVLSTLIGLFALAAIGTTTLFKSEPIVVQTQENADELIQQALKPYPAIRYTFNKNTGGLLLWGHVSSLAEKNQLLYVLQTMKFVKSIDPTQIVNDEGVWQEVNSILSRTPAWRDITIYSPAAGQFVLSGYLQTRKQAEQLSSYISLNFPYLDLLKKEIVVEEDVINQINRWLQEAQLTDVAAQMTNGTIVLDGTAPADKINQINGVIEKIKHIPGVRVVNSLVKAQTVEMGIKDISEEYPVTGKSRIGNKYTVVIHGRILSEGDDLDDFTITSITADRVLLEKEGMKYRIDY